MGSGVKLHQCRCAICGEIGVIVPLVPNVYGSGDIYTPTPPQVEPVATCIHGYTICAPCKFPPDSKKEGSALQAS